MNSVFNMILQSLHEGKGKVVTEISKYRNRTFLEATIASVIFIAMADGRVTPDEKDRLFAYIQQADELAAFSSDEVIAAYTAIIKYYDFDNKMGNAEALKIVARMKADEEQALFMVRAACVIAMKDGVLKDVEKEAVRTLCAELGVALDKIQM